MQCIVGYGLKLHLVVIYIGYWSAVDSLQWNVESISELDFEEANTPMGPNGPNTKLIYRDDRVYDGWIDSKFIHVHKSVLVIT